LANHRECAGLSPTFRRCPRDLIHATWSPFRRPALVKLMLCPLPPSWDSGAAVICRETLQRWKNHLDPECQLDGLIRACAAEWSVAGGATIHRTEVVQSDFCTPQVMRWQRNRPTSKPALSRVGGGFWKGRRDPGARLSDVG
jgi:hypothetical protein